MRLHYHPMKKTLPRVVRPLIKESVGARFWEFCQDERLVFNDAATEAIEQWLQRQQALKAKAS